MDTLCLWIGRAVLVVGGGICVVIAIKIGLDLAITDAEFIRAFYQFCLERRRGRLH